MHKGFLWSFIGVLLVIGAFFAGYSTHDYVYKYINGFTLGTILPSASQYPGAVAAPGSASGAPPAPAQTQTVAQMGPYKVTAISPTSVTVQISYGKTKTYAITPDTKLYSVAAPGETGKSMSDIVPGSTYLMVTPSSAGSNTALSLAFYRAPSVQLTAEDINSSVAGTITALSGSSLTIKPVDTSVQPVTITLSPSTQIITQVAAGQVGKSLAVGMYVVANGVENAGSGVTANILTVPLSAPAQK